MNDGQQADAADVLASIGRHWGWIMAFGVGLYAVRHVLVTLLALALLVVIFWIVNGSVVAFRLRSPGHRARTVLSMPSEGAAPCR
jgi:hypothetical protein